MFPIHRMFLTVYASIQLRSILLLAPFSVTLDLARINIMSSHASQTLFLNGPVGRLEAILWTPNHPRVPHLAAVVCHPHPLFGGTMHNKVAYQAAKSLDALGIPVLRFNFRGAGLSAGVHDKGRGEQGDVHAAIDFLATEFPHTPLLLGGFSFGSWVGLWMGCADPRVTDLIGLGVPVNDSDFTYLSACAKPKLFVSGSDDEYGAPEKVEELVAMLPGENRFVLIDDADHFFTGHLALLDRAITQWLVERHPDLVAP
jgi:alpha/beta superfamily hydrolase